MLNNLTIENYALIGKLKIDFDKGLNLLTGETGAGKSIIIGALSTVLGERTGADVVRAGEQKAYVEAAFSLDRSKRTKSALKDLGIEPEEQIIISREILSAGKSQARINGRAVTQSALKAVSRTLIDIHGQHEHQSLLEPENHIDLLDNLGGHEMSGVREKVSGEYSKLTSLNSELSTLLTGKAEREKQVDFIKYQVKEIDEAGLKDREDEELKEERDLLGNAEKLAAGAADVKALISGVEEGGAIDKIRAASTMMKEIAQFDKNLGKMQKQVESAYFDLEDASREIALYGDKMTFDPDRLKEVEERLETIRDLKRKYGETIKDILKKKEKFISELEGLEFSDEKVEKLKTTIAESKEKLGKLCSDLSDKRKVLAKEIEKGIKEELAELNMPKIQFQVKMESVEDVEGVMVKGKGLRVGAKGVDQVEFLISPNPGEPLKPLAKIASGGEISRVMLALKSILSKADDIPTMIFDEIDTGIGGQTAVRVGDKLAALSKHRQIICITHLPQIASKPGRHLHVSKSVEGAKTHVSVRELKGDDRVTEVANLLGGAVTEATLKTARELVGI